MVPAPDSGQWMIGALLGWRIWGPDGTEQFSAMRYLIRLVLLLLILMVGGGYLLAGGWDMAPPTHTVEKVIPNDRF